MMEERRRAKKQDDGPVAPLYTYVARSMMSISTRKPGRGSEADCLCFMDSSALPASL